MGIQIIRQPDGKYALFSDNVDTWIMCDAEPDDCIRYFVERAADDERRRATRTMEAVASGDPRKVYYQFAMTFEEADETSKEHTGKTLDDLRREWDEYPVSPDNRPDIS